MPAIRPIDLPAGSPNNTAAIIFDNGSTVQKATPSGVLDAAAPLATQAEAEAGSDNATRMSPLRVSQAVDAQIKDPLASSGGSQLVTFTRFETAGAPQNVEVKLSNLRSVTDFTTPAAADGNSGTLFTPTATTSTIATGASLAANYWGPAQVQTADGNRRAKWFANITAPPSSEGDADWIETAFNGDWSKSLFPVEHRISGATTLGQPTTGYRYVNETCPFFGVIYNTSGYNHSTSTNDGRTAAAFFRVNLKQYGQGDLMGYNATAIVASTRPGATSFLANPAVALFCGDIGGGADGVYLNPREIICSDNGFDVACVGDVVNFVRTNNTGALGVYWGAYRAQNQGSAAPDNVISAAGEWKAGVDFSMTDFGAGKAAVALKADHRIFLNATSSNAFYATSLGGSFIEHNSGINGILFATGGTSRFLIQDTQVTASVNFAATAAVLLSGLQSSASYANDAAAAVGGVVVGQLYRNGSVVQIRVA